MKPVKHIYEIILPPSNTTVAVVVAASASEAIEYICLDKDNGYYTKCHVEYGNIHGPTRHLDMFDLRSMNIKPESSWLDVI